MPNVSKFADPKVRAKFLEQIALGRTVRQAAKHAGASHGAYQRYAAEHPAFAEAVVTARAKVPVTRPPRFRIPKGETRPGDLCIFEHHDGTMTADVYASGMYHPYQEPLLSEKGANLVDIPVTDIGDLVVRLEVVDNIHVVNIWARDTRLEWRTLLGSVRCEQMWPKTESPTTSASHG